MTIVIVAVVTVTVVIFVTILILIVATVTVGTVVLVTYFSKKKPWHFDNRWDILRAAFCDSHQFFCA